jgi:hypothetical protein
MVAGSNADMREFLGLQEALVREIGSVRTIALSGDGTRARSQFLSRAEAAEKAASKLTDGFIDETEKRIEQLAVEAERLRSLAAWLLFSVGWPRAGYIAWRRDPARVEGHRPANA